MKFQTNASKLKIGNISIFEVVNLPDPSVGEKGDLAIDRVAPKLYQKLEEGWFPIFAESITDFGFTGSQGDTGFVGSQGDTGVSKLVYDIVDVGASVGYSATTSFANALLAPSTENLRYIIESIQLTNYSSVDRTASLQLRNGDVGTNESNLINDIPLPIGTSVEVLKEYKVLNPSGRIRATASADSSVSVNISYLVVDDTKFFTNVNTLSNTDMTDLFQSSNSNGSVVNSILISNDSNMAEKITLVWTNSSNTIQGYYASELIIPDNGNVELLIKPKFIQNGFKIRAQAENENVLNIFVTGFNR